MDTFGRSGVAALACAIVACTQAAGLDDLRFEGAAGAGAGGAQMAGSTGGALACGDNREPYGDGCPAPCTHCFAGRCEIDCGLTTCAVSDVMCPPGFNCVSACAQDGSCLEANFGCPPDTACELECAGPAACDGATLFCSGGSCSLQCSGNDGPCANANVECSHNRCQATCELFAGLPSLDCGEACECDPCEFLDG